ncbi:MULTISPECIES: DJ-1/PfpI family protein [Streptomyces]|uniref:Transcriptional regulator GlxA family with amidase domain n=1 Tax=Streptomyces stelliscabiei TaxID=146820 RepID=A0A8I0NXK9_9ACTN|nr:MULTISPECIES: DJ-1/PfpI family protein [Streptomyces]KND45883.1 thiamine biosynthesis protein ThiJ [Streptomyces stelliscabiei]MBE1594355.1 transcriptional regulator GlxA family with amidase domain [Streptomyces stelliscabiei]MDX2522062.1 DJ-1/PfpI family protein [Streptomyces stelliscabiei]MDX2557963.1 DJ-1/PfpI family protein [Streptomyces stelliscabiei]MDX2617772.1 DJ-1/PfpI family protein [Streptomyces stelliscabiei]
MSHSTTRRNVLRGTAATAVLAATAAAARTETAYAVQPGGSAGPNIGILLYDGYSLLDPTGPAEILSRLPDATVTMIAEKRGAIRTDTGDVAVVAERSIAEVDRLDVLLVPGAGNRGTIGAMNNQALLRWIRRMHRHTQWTTSVCTGSIVLAAAGLLDGREATTYWASADYLRSTFDVTYLPQRYVRSGKIITAAGVSAGVDMALYLASLIADDDTAKAIQLAVEYDPQPPFGSGNASHASPQLKEHALQLLAASQV